MCSRLLLLSLSALLLSTSLAPAQPAAGANESSPSSAAGATVPEQPAPAICCDTWQMHFPAAKSASHPNRENASAPRERARGPAEKREGCDIDPDKVGAVQAHRCPSKPQ